MRRLLFKVFASLFALLYLPSTVAALQLTGQMQQGGLVIGQVEPDSLVTLDQRAVKVSKQGVFVIGFGRDAKANAELTIENANGDKTTKTLTIAARQYNIQRIEGIAKKIISPSAANIQRSREEAAQVRKARAQFLDRMDFLSQFQWPLIGPITGVYGSQRVYNGVPGRPHYGIDIAAPMGAPVSTPAPGIVTLVHQDMFYSGGTLIIDHGYGVSSTMIHLSKVIAKVGDQVVPGDIVAEVGAGGRATGPHLDWRMNWMQQRIDPQLLVPPMPAQ
ncbi:M23 family metallopeptidase [uncultured Oceanicoccus sp.]|uniref:M23 family metallopeptidase n=1 Tax=uncultured Oceanicoccus sp. TaxID=1706381 RepID=UPI0030D835D8